MLSNNGYLSKPFNVSRGIFQGCPISPYLFVLAIEILAVAIRENNDIQGINIGEIEKKVSLFADDTIFFFNGDTESFVNLFEILHYFASFSGCRINVSTSEAIYIGGSKDTTNRPYQEEGLTWRTKSFKALGINFSLQTNLLYEMNFNNNNNN